MGYGISAGTNNHILERPADRVENFQPSSLSLVLVIWCDNGKWLLNNLSGYENLLLSVHWKQLNRLYRVEGIENYLRYHWRIGWSPARIDRKENQFPSPDDDGTEPPSEVTCWAQIEKELSAMWTTNGVGSNHHQYSSAMLQRREYSPTVAYTFGSWST